MLEVDNIQHAEIPTKLPEIDAEAHRKTASDIERMNSEEEEEEDDDDDDSSTPPSFDDGLKMSASGSKTPSPEAKHFSTTATYMSTSSLELDNDMDRLTQFDSIILKQQQRLRDDSKFIGASMTRYSREKERERESQSFNQTTCLALSRFPLVPPLIPQTFRRSISPRTDNKNVRRFRADSHPLAFARVFWPSKIPKRRSFSVDNLKLRWPTTTTRRLLC